MIRVVYITTSFSDKGPLQQLFNIINSLDRSIFEPIVISLTKPFERDKTELFKTLNIEIHHFPWKWQYILLPFISFKNLLKDLKPKIIHSSGFLPDVLCAFSFIKYPWFLTIRNDPFIDYPLKFGLIKGNILAICHLGAIKICPNPITCSLGLNKAFRKYKVWTKTVRNGVNVDLFRYDKNHKRESSSKIRFLTTGSLIDRKNIELMVLLFSSKNLYDISELIVLGDGILYEKCLKISKDNIFFKGHMANVTPYFYKSDYYISLSKSEGMPNSVMEAMVEGLPCVLSDIDPHQEIKSLMPNASYILNISMTFTELENRLKDIILERKDLNHSDIAHKASKIFDSEINSKEYQKLYVDKLNIL
jgi:glycosyltransferase involved in cell wall biosynthesis